MPIGGGYTDASLQQFARRALAHIPGANAEILVVPSAYGDAITDRKANLALAQKRTDAIAELCQAVVQPPVDRCSARLVPLLDRADAMDSANSEPFSNPAVAGVFFLGGDQDVAMRVLAGSPAETAMHTAFERGVVFSGTSAGDSVESVNMVAGFASGYGPESEFRRAAVQVWWADSKARRRGLKFGARGVLLDQHFYQRGRFGRLVNMVAHSADHYDGRSLLGIGIDRGTGVVEADDNVLEQIFGASSAAVIDFQTAGATYHWTGAQKALSARHILTHILAPDPHLTYSLAKRMPQVDGRAIALRQPESWTPCLFKTSSRGELILGGGRHAQTPATAVLRAFLRASHKARVKKIVIVAAGFANVREAHAAAVRDRRALRAADWTHSFKIQNFSPGAPWLKTPHSAELRTAAYLLRSDNASKLAQSLADPAFHRYLNSIAADAPVVMTEGAMTAAMGDQWAVAQPVSADKVADAAIASFRAGGVDIRPALGVFDHVNLVPHLLRDRRWGTLYSLVKTDRAAIAFGIGSDSAIVVKPAPAASAGCPAVGVVGEHPVVALDGRAATFRPATNGTFSALNVLMNVFAPGDRLAGGHRQ